MALFAGFGATDLTPPIGVELAGYGYYLNRRAERVMDPLFARAISIRQGDVRFIAISCDLLGLDEAGAARTRELLRDRHGLAGDRVLLVCTHTHTGPAVDWLEGCGVRDDAYANSLPERIAQAAAAAIGDERPVTGFARCERAIEPVGFNRADPDGPLDAHVRGAALYRGDCSPIALVSHGCHPVTLGRSTAISADYPGWVCAAMAERGFRAAFFNGLCGDVDPVSNRDAWGSGTVDTIAGYGRRIADGFAGGLVDGPIPSLRAARLRFALRVRQVDAAAAADAVEALRGPDSPETRVARVWQAEMAARAAADVEYADVSMAALSDVVLAALPYEGFTAIADCARAHLPGRVALILGCADKTMGYLPAAGEFERGSYAASASAMLYMRPLFVPGQAEALGDGLGKALARAFPIE
ncbi:MAG: hypothetical protein GX558_01680 [Clostridiales bacterium]|nr:hypothetical protein [Clostridiales bacterium]